MEKRVGDREDDGWSGNGAGDWRRQDDEAGQASRPHHKPIFFPFPLHHRHPSPSSPAFAAIIPQNSRIFSSTSSMAPSAMHASTSLMNVACSSISKSSFVSGSNPSRLSSNRTPLTLASPSRSLTVQAKKGEWLPGLASPAYLDGSLPGDNGFDPLGLGEDPANLKWYVQAELQNGRWAMLGVAGMLIPEFLTKIGIINVPEWYDAGKVEYFAPASTLFVIEFILFHYVEIRRWQDIKYPGSVNADPFNPSLKLPPGEVGYPGGIFNPLNFPTTLEYKEKELANGRLAMLAFLGFVIQHNLTGKGPLDNLFQHLADPWHNTIVQTLQGL